MAPDPDRPATRRRTMNPTTRRTQRTAARIRRPAGPEAQENQMPKSKATGGRPPTPIRELPLVALRETVIFPEMIVPLQVGRDKSVQALNKAVADSTPIALDRKSVV